MSTIAASEGFSPADIQRTKNLLVLSEFCRFQAITDRTFRRQVRKGKLTVISGPVGRNGKPVPMISIDQLSQAGLTRWVAEQTAKYQAAIPAIQTPLKSPLVHGQRSDGGTEEDRRQLDRREMDRDRAALWARYERATNTQKEEASRRLRAVQAVETLVASGVGRVAAIDTVATQNPPEVPPCPRGDVTSSKGEKSLSRVTLYRWFELVKGLDASDRLAALVPRYAGCQVQAPLSVEAWDYFKADYLRLEKPAASACHERLQRVAADRGWTVPTVDTLLYRLRSEMPKQAILLAREGVEALRRSYPAQQRDKSVFHALEAVNADGHKFDVFVKWADGTVGRPVMAAWQDIYSGKLLGQRVGKTESSDLIRLSFGDMVTGWGIPSFAWLDNGRGFASKWLTGGTPTRYRFKVQPEDPTGIMVQMGVQIHWCTPYWGQAKPIERAFRDLCESVSKHPEFSGAYTGNSPANKPENYGSKAIPLDKFMAVLATEIVAHNARQGRRAPACAQRSFDQTFDESYQRSPIRKATAEQMNLWLLAAEGVSSSRQDGSVTLAGNRYWDEALAQHAGERLVVRFDPDQLHSWVYCYTLEGKLIGSAACIAAVGFNDTEAAREHARLRNANVKKQKEILAGERRMTALEAAELLPTLDVPEPPAAKVVRPFFATATGTHGRVASNDDGELGELLEILRERKAAEGV